MFLKIGLVLLAAWLVAWVSLPMIGELVHVFLLAGLMLTFIGFLKAHEAAVTAARTPDLGRKDDRHP